MFVAVLAGMIMALVLATAMVQRRTRRQLLGAGDDGRGAEAALLADAGAERSLARETARQESHHVRHMGEFGG